MQTILSGLRIVGGSAFIAAPMCGMTLAQLGAEVIRFDQIGRGIDYRRWPLTADNTSLYWAAMNKGKKSIAVDLAAPEARELITALICAGGDAGGIFSTNMPARGWLAYETLQARRGDLIQHEIVGDRHGRPALDYTVNAKVGLPYLPGPEDDVRPVNHVLPAWDIATAYLAALGILAAERHRRLTGEGQRGVKLSLADVALGAMGHLGYITGLTVNDGEREHHGNYLYGALGRDFVTADDERVMVIALTRKQWHGLVAASGLQADFDVLAQRLGCNFDDEGERFPVRYEICAILERWMESKTLAELAPVFDDNGICWDRYQTARELVKSDPDCSDDNPIFSMVEQPGIGSYLVPGHAMDFSTTPRRAPELAPVVGQHTDEVLGDVLGMGDAEIGVLPDQGIVASASNS